MTIWIQTWTTVKQGEPMHVVMRSLHWRDTSYESFGPSDTCIQCMCKTTLVVNPQAGLSCAERVWNNVLMECYFLTGIKPNDTKRRGLYYDVPIHFIRNLEAQKKMAKKLHKAKSWSTRPLNIHQFFPTKQKSYWRVTFFKWFLHNQMLVILHQFPPSVSLQSLDQLATFKSCTPCP